MSSELSKHLQQPRKRRGFLLLISSPSGAGKTSLSRRLVADHADLALSISATTRPARPGEEHEREYYFVSSQEFDEMEGRGEFLEWANVHEHRYGTPKTPVMAALDLGKDVLFDIDWQGAKQIADNAREDSVRVFILPPSMAELSRRLYARAQDSVPVIEGRLRRAYDEIAQWGLYDYVLVNEDYDRAYADVAHIYHAERLRRDRQGWVAPFVQGLMAEKVV
ncbi:guanylate kinase [Phenylobacterium sp.]|uniref:guanylate kinase n=1 Tax=Phenylobacterium sp. TaxID=1871053 RepID=UPI00398318B1